MKASRWAILAVVLAVAAVVIAKETIKGGSSSRVSAAVPATAAERPSTAGSSVVPAPEEGAALSLAPSQETPHPRSRSAGQKAEATPAGSRAQASGEKPAAPSANVKQAPGGRPAPDQTLAPAEPAVPAQQPADEPGGPLPGSELTACLESGLPTLADFGLGTCKPCKAMAPILKQATKDYSGKANIVFVELDKYPRLGRQYRIAVMPTQIFFDASGKQVGSHLGFMDREEIDRRLAALGTRR